MLSVDEATMLSANESTLTYVNTDTYGERFAQGLARPGKTRAGVAAAMGVTVQAVSQIVRGITKSATASNNSAAAAYFGCDPGWLATGKGSPGWEAGNMNEVHGRPKEGTSGPEVRETLAHPASHKLLTVAHTMIAWGDLVSDVVLPDQFLLAMPDDSMAPDAPAGTLIWFEARTDARPPDWVLLTDDAGNWYVREYKERRPGHWEAHAAEGSGRLPLDSIRDGLTVKAIYVGQRGRKGGGT